MESDTFWLSVLLKRVWSFQELMFQFGKVAKMETLVKTNYDILLFPIFIDQIVRYQITQIILVVWYKHGSNMKFLIRLEKLSKCKTTEKDNIAQDMFIIMTESFFGKYLELK